MDSEKLKFDALLLDKRHEEMKTLLEKIITALSSANNTDIILQTKKLSQVVELLQSLIAVNTKSSVDVSPIERACNEVVKSNERLISSIENRMLPDSFDIMRDTNGVRTVRVNYTPAKEINNMYNGIN